MYNAKKQNELEIKKNREIIENQKIAIENIVEYERTELKIYTDDEMKGLDLSKRELENDLPLRMIDIMNIKKYIGNRLKLDNDQIQMLIVKLCIDDDTYNKYLCLRIKYGDIVLSSIYMTIYKKTHIFMYHYKEYLEQYELEEDDLEKNVYNKDMEYILTNIKKETMQIINYYDSIDDDSSNDE